MPHGVVAVIGQPHRVVGRHVDTVRAAKHPLAPGAQEVALAVEHDHGVPASIERVHPVLRVDADRGDVGVEFLPWRQLRPVVDDLVAICARAQDDRHCALPGRAVTRRHARLPPLARISRHRTRVRGHGEVEQLEVLGRRRSRCAAGPPISRAPRPPGCAVSDRPRSPCRPSRSACRRTGRRTTWIAPTRRLRQPIGPDRLLGAHLPGRLRRDARGDEHLTTERRRATRGADGRRRVRRACARAHGCTMSDRALASCIIRRPPFGLRIDAYYPEPRADSYATVVTGGRRCAHGWACSSWAASRINLGSSPSPPPTAPRWGGRRASRPVARSWLPRPSG